MNDFFTVNELAKYFRLNPKTIYRKLWVKGIPAYKVGRIWKIAKKDIIWLKRSLFLRLFLSNQVQCSLTTEY